MVSCRFVPLKHQQFARIFKKWLQIATWWFIPLSKWVITPVINGISRVNPLIIGVITHLLSGMSHQVPVLPRCRLKVKWWSIKKSKTCRLGHKNGGFKLQWSSMYGHSKAENYDQRWDFKASRCLNQTQTVRFPFPLDSVQGLSIVVSHILETLLRAAPEYWIHMCGNPAVVWDMLIFGGHMMVFTLRLWDDKLRKSLKLHESFSPPCSTGDDVHLPTDWQSLWDFLRCSSQKKNKSSPIC